MMVKVKLFHVSGKEIGPFDVEQTIADDLIAAMTLYFTTGSPIGKVIRCVMDGHKTTFLVGFQTGITFVQIME